MLPYDNNVHAIVKGCMVWSVEREAWILPNIAGSNAKDELIIYDILFVHQ